jgi:hypothetical protein
LLAIAAAFMLVGCIALYKIRAKRLTTGLPKTYDVESQELELNQRELQKLIGNERRPAKVVLI